MGTAELFCYILGFHEEKIVFDKLFLFGSPHPPAFQAPPVDAGPNGGFRDSQLLRDIGRRNAVFVQLLHLSPDFGGIEAKAHQITLNKAILMCHSGGSQNPGPSSLPRLDSSLRWNDIKLRIFERWH